MVSEADRLAEEAIVAMLRDERPDDGLLGEEGASVEGSSGRRWVVDPLDGTTNYLYGIPQWAVSIAVEDGSGTLAGVVFDPVANELFAAERGGGAELRAGGAARALNMKDAAPLERALVATGFSYEPARREHQARTLTHVLPRVRDVRRAGAAALDLSWLAAGRLDGYWERGLNAWDWAAGRLIVAEAGGVVEDLAGQPSGLIAGPRSGVAELRELVLAAESLSHA